MPRDYVISLIDRHGTTIGETLVTEANGPVDAILKHQFIEPYQPHNYQWPIRVQVAEVRQWGGGITHYPVNHGCQPVVIVKED